MALVRALFLRLSHKRSHSGGTKRGGLQRGEVSPQTMSLWKESYCWPREHIVPQQVICDPLAHPCVKTSFYFLFSLACNTYSLLLFALGNCCSWWTTKWGLSCRSCVLSLHSHCHTRTMALSEPLQELDIDSLTVSVYCLETVNREVNISLQFCTLEL